MLTCELKQTAIVDGVMLTWVILVEGNVYTTHRGNFSEVERFDFFLDGAGHGTSIGNLTVMASAANNNSQIRCRIDNLHVEFDDANLMVVGKLFITLSLELAWSLKTNWVCFLCSCSQCLYTR